MTKTTYTKELDKLKKDLDPTGLLMHLASELPDMEIRSTGIIGLDLASQVGGFPVGKQVEIYGRESVGKSVLSYYMLAASQKVDERFCAYIDLEDSFDDKNQASWAKQCVPDLDMDRLVTIKAGPSEDAVNKLVKAIESGIFSMVVFDSIGAMLSESEMEKGNSKVGGQAKIVGEMVRKVRIPATMNKCTVVYINQVRDLIGLSLPIETTPGGHGIRHMTVIRVHLKPGKPRDKGTGESTVRMGFRVTAKLVKNKVGVPLGRCGWEFHNRPNEEGIVGIDLNQDLLDAAINLGVISKSGSWYTHELFGTVQGTDPISDFFKSNPKSRETIRRELVDKVRRDQYLSLEVGGDDDEEIEDGAS